MFLFDLFRSYIPVLNPLGFGAADYLELVITILLVALTLLARPRIESLVEAFAQKTLWCMLLLAALPIALRLTLLPHSPIPSPGVSDDFSYLLLADTLSHFRLANPTHPMHEFFETFFILQQPTYSSIFPLGQGLVLALGRMIFGHLWAGVALSIGTFCALCYWMLRGWTTPVWALAGGLLAVSEFGPLNQWMNSYWGGAVSATAGCLVFGALPRLRDRGRMRDAVLLGVGLGLQLLTRPFEFVLLIFVVVPFLPVRQLRTIPWAVLPILAAAALMLGQNKAVTGSWITLPYQVSRDQYGVPAAFTVQPNPVPHRALTLQQQLDYEAQCAVHGRGTDTIGSYFARLGFRVRYYRFFFLPPLLLALPFFFMRLKKSRVLWVLGSIAIFSLGTNFYPYFYSHYIAAIACLFVLVSVMGLERVSSFHRQAAGLLLTLCFAHFIFWYGVHLFDLQALTQYETWDAINYGDPEGRIAVTQQLTNAPGKQLVFVHYGPRHAFEEWVHNAADIDRSRVVWARDLGADKNEKLRLYYPDRTAWQLEPDIRPPKLTPYQPSLVP